MTTRDPLEALFRTEVERMGEHLDNLQFAARRIAPARRNRAADVLKEAPQSRRAF